MSTGTTRDRTVIESTTDRPVPSTARERSRALPPAHRERRAGDVGHRRPATFPLRPAEVPADAAKPAPSRAQRFLRDVIRGAALVVGLHLFVVQISVVRGHSMEPSLFDGDRLVVDRISYSFLDVERFDVVVLRNPRDLEVDYVKRVAGLPGDVVAMIDGHLYVNDEPVPESFGYVPDHDCVPRQVVPEGHFWVLGDNRPISCDSREFGLVRQELIKGKVRFRFWPLSRAATF